MESIAYVCLSCYNVFNQYVKVDEYAEYNNCPISSCCGVIAEIDDLFVPVIIELNKKGYMTKFCCSGHYYESFANAYIMFYEDTELSNIPKGYVLENNLDGTICIRNNFGNVNQKTMDKYKYHIEILKNAETTLKWAKNLPDISC